MKTLLICFVVTLSLVSVQGSIDWVNRASFKDFATYFPNLMLHTIYEVENYGWWNLRLNTINYNINFIIYDRHFQGNASYTNGFLVSIQKIEFTNIMQDFRQGTVTYTTTGTMTGLLKFYDLTVGHDVLAHLEDQDHRFTGVFTYPEVDYVVNINKNLNTSAVTTTFRLNTLRGGSGNFMRYMPETDISDVVQRFFLNVDNWSSMDAWGSQIFGPAMTRLMGEDELGFPEVCFSC